MTCRSIIYHRNVFVQEEFLKVYNYQEDVIKYSVFIKMIIWGKNFSGKRKTAKKHCFKSFWSVDHHLLKVPNVNDLTNVFYKPNMPCLWFVWRYNESFYNNTALHTDTHHQIFKVILNKFCFTTNDIGYLLSACCSIGLSWYQLHSYANPHGFLG